MEEHLVTPEVLFCGFKRIGASSRTGPVSRDAAVQTVLVTVSLPEADPAEVTLPIEALADIQALAHEIQADYLTQEFSIACLVDQKSDSILRWNDLIRDVIHSDSIIQVMPMYSTPLRLRVIAPRPYRDKPRTKLDLAFPAPPGTGPDSGTNGSPLTLPPLPTTPIPEAVSVSLPLDQICTNALLLLAFARFCAKKKTLVELLFWLDTSVALPGEAYASRVYLGESAPLRLNIPSEVATIQAARSMLSDGPLAWSECRFRTTAEYHRIAAIQGLYPKYYKKATITIQSDLHPARQKFIQMMSLALDPLNTSVLSLAEREMLSTRQAILEQVCNQYFPNKQIDTAHYLEDARARELVRRPSYLDHRHDLQSSRKTSPQQLSRESSRRDNPSPDIRTSRTSRPRRTPSHRSTHDLGIGEVMPMEDADVVGWSDVVSVKSAEFVSHSLDTSTSTPRHSAFDHDIAARKRDQSPASIASSVSSSSVAVASSSEDTQDSTRLTSLEGHHSDMLRRQTKLRTLLGVSPSPAAAASSPKSAMKKQDAHDSPTPSVISRFSGTSSRIGVSRAEQDEEDERRTQLRRAAKLYAMFGEHTESSASIDRARHARHAYLSESSARPTTSASQYSPAGSRAPSRTGSISAYSLHSPTSSQQTSSPTSILGKSSNRYQPDRSNDRKTFKNSFGMFKTSKSSSAAAAAANRADLLANFPAPPLTSSAKSSPSMHSRAFASPSLRASSSLYPDDESILEEDSDEQDIEGDAIYQDVRTNMKLRQLLGDDAPTSVM